MLTRDQAEIAYRRRAVAETPTPPPTQVNRCPESTCHQHPEGDEMPEETPRPSHVQEVSEGKEMIPGKLQKGNRSSFGLDEIRTIVFRCGRCRTVVRFPRIRWTSFPDSCPNCRTQWMTAPTAQGSWQEDTSTYVFRVVLAFREALQALVSMEGTAVFRLALEMGECQNDGHVSAAPATGRNGSSRG